MELEKPVKTSINFRKPTVIQDENDNTELDLTTEEQENEPKLEKPERVKIPYPRQHFASVQDNG